MYYVRNILMNFYKNLHKCITFPHSYPTDNSPSPWNVTTARWISLSWTV